MLKIFQNKIFLSILAGANLFALSIEEAVELGFQNNLLLQKKQYIVEESKVDYDLTYSNYKPKIDLSYNYTNYEKTAINQTKENSTASATVSYNLFNGFYDKYNIQASKSSFDSSKYTFEAFKKDLELDIKTAYINCLKAVKNTQTLDAALKSYIAQYDDAKVFYDQGLIAYNELLEIEVSLLESKQLFQSAKVNENILKLNLQNLIGKKIDGDFEDPVFKDADNFDKESLNNRSELKALEYSLKSLYFTNEALKSGFFPKVDASVSVNSYGDEVEPNNKTGFPDTQTVSSVNLKWNLYEGDKDDLSRVKTNKKIAQIKSSIEDLKQNLLLQFESAKRQLEVSKLNLETSEKALESSKLNYEIVQKKLKEGIGSNKDLLDANFLLTKAKQNYFNAFYDRYLNIAKLYRITQK